MKSNINNNSNSPHYGGDARKGREGLLISILSIIMCLFGCKSQSEAFRSVMPDEFEKVIANKNVVRLDVRTAEEWAEGHIAGTKNIDVLKDDFEAKATAELPKNKTIALYCRSGRRSKNAATILSAKGYKVVELDNGYLGWTGAGKPIEK